MTDDLRCIVAGVQFRVMPLTEAIYWCAEVSLGARAVHFGPAYTVALAQHDTDYRAVLNAADAVFSDGMPVVWAGKWLHPDAAPNWTRVYGPDVMTGVLAASQRGVQRHYLLGGSQETLAALQQTIAADFPDAEIVGAESPPYRPATTEELAARDARIAAASATHVWVGLGTPKQDWEVRRLADQLPVTALAVGAAFDFIAGIVDQAPGWMQRSGLEWTYRLAKEPRRLAGRYLWGNPVFVAAVARQAIGRGATAHGSAG